MASSTIKIDPDFKLLQKRLDNRTLKYHTVDSTIYEKIIQEVIYQIKQFENPESPIWLFQLLQEYQSLLAKASFSEGITFSETINTFIHDFDRLDDKKQREYLFQEIKYGNYSW